MRKLTCLGLAAGMGLAIGFLPPPRAQAATLTTCQVNPPTAEAACHPVLGFAADVPVTIDASGVNLPLTVSLTLRMGADLALSDDPATLAPGNTAALGLTYTPTDDPGPEFVLDVDSNPGTISAGGHTISLSATHLIAAAKDFAAPLDGDAPVSVPLLGDTMTACVETDIGCIDVLHLTLGGTLTVSFQPAPCLSGANVILGGGASVLCDPFTGPTCTNATVKSPPLGLLDWGLAGQTLPATIQLANPLPAGATIGLALTPLIHWVHVDTTLDATLEGAGIFSFIGTTTIPLIGRNGKVADNLGDALVSFGLVDAIASAAGTTIGPLIKPVVAMGSLPVPLLDPQLPHITNAQSLTLGTVGFTLLAGKCAGVTCTAQDACHDAGTCDPATGLCSNPPKLRAAIEASCEAQGMGCTNARDHRQYVQCVSGQAKAAVKNGTLAKACKAPLVHCATNSTCARKPGAVTCCVTNGKGVTKCAVKSSATRCTAPKGGQACIGNVPSCCDACTPSGCASTTTTVTSSSTTTTTLNGGGLECACNLSSDCHSSAPCCCTGLPGGNTCMLQQDCAAGGGTCECDSFDVQLFQGVCPGKACGQDSQCSAVEFCTGGVCTLRQPKGGPCAFSSGCLDACCCDVPGGSSATCDLQTDCAASGGTCQCAAGDAELFGGICPGTACSEDSQCSGIEFCTGGVCTLKQPHGESCAFSSGCVESCCCTVPGIGSSVCSTQTDCAASGGACQCAAGDAGLFGGVCPGTPCSQDSQCSTIEFCTGGVCTLKQPDGGPCAFSSGCTEFCCCSLPGAAGPTCGAQLACYDDGGSCECSGGDAHLFGGVCPGTPCSEDSQCSGLEFCTGGVCTLKQPSGGPCAFSSGCTDACCCTLPGASSATCSLQGSCAEDGGSCQCSSGDAQLFGGICPGHPCGQDNQCSSVEFCTGGACTLKLPGGGPCSFSSGCLDGCCCGGTCTFPGACGGTCAP
jgi:hypothetical protein